MNSIIDNCPYVTLLIDLCDAFGLTSLAEELTTWAEARGCYIY